jgi:hypothetical protein
MIYILIFFLLFIIFMILENNVFIFYEELVIVLKYIFLFLSIIWLLILPFSRFMSKVNALDFSETKKTIEIQRKDKELTEYERATITSIIIEKNNWLAYVKYMNKKKWFYDYYIVDDVENLTPIE